MKDIDQVENVQTCINKSLCERTFGIFMVWKGAIMMMPQDVTT